MSSKGMDSLCGDVMHVQFALKAIKYISSSQFAERSETEISFDADSLESNTV
jgi:hypothetical protein